MTSLTTCFKDKSFFIEQFKKCDEVTYLNEKQSDSFNADRKTFIIDKEKTKERKLSKRE